MITDPAIREQGYAYFLGEAPELLQTIEQDLYTLVESSSTAKIHNLMRATHTIKGGAANVGLDTIMTIAHSLEDIFKALYNLEIDGELQALLVEGYECLQLAVTAEVTNSNINAEGLLTRATATFAQIQEKLGDAFGQESHIPTSEELGFDIVKSIFEVGVKQRLESLNQAINEPPDNTEFCELLHSQSEVFIGLAESLNLPGLETLARTIMAAVDANPKKVLKIAQIAFNDLKAAQIAVLGGDRTSGGSPSPELQELANITDNNYSPVTTTSSLATVPKYGSSLASIHQSFAETFFNITTEFYQFLITLSNGNNEPLKPVHAKVYLKAIRYVFGWFNHYREIPESELNLSLLIPPPSQKYPVDYLEAWLEEFIYFIENAGDSQSLCLYRRGIILIILLSIAKFQYTVEQNNSAIPIIKKLRQQIRELGKEYKNYPPVNEAEKNWLDHPKLQDLLVIKEINSSLLLGDNNNLLESIWGGEPILEPDDNDQVVPTQVIETGEAIKHDSYLESVTSSAVSEEVITDDETLKINQQIEEKTTDTVNRNSRQPSFVRVDVEGLQRLNYLTGELLIYQKRRTLYDDQVVELIDRLSQQLNQHQQTLYQLRDLPLQGHNVASHNTQEVSTVNFDSLEMDIYSEFQLTLHSAMEETLQIQETSESLELLMRQAGQISEKKQTLTLSIIDNLVEARMLTLGTILSRFPQMVQNLANVYGKQVELKLTGTTVLVDKAIAEKLYDPLLQLVRNSFDHGIELPEIRRERGKFPQGIIEIRAYNQGSQTVIEIHDDGQGLNLEKVRSRAIELHLIPDDHHGDYIHHLTESELIEMMFAPGFSTAGKVSEISGRGMGLDIVRTQLQSLNGSISVQSSPHQGTTFILKIPFSMTTDKLMLVQAGGVIYALLQDSIEKIVIPSAQQIKEFEGKQFLHWRTDDEELMVKLQKLEGLMYYNGAVINMNNLQNLPDTSEVGMVKNPILILRHNQGMVGIEVDQIIGEQELVIRPLGSSITPPKYVYGCSSLANGNLILIIDGTLLINTQEMQATLDVMTLPMISPTNQPALPMSEETISSPPLITAINTQQQLTGNVSGNSKLPKVILVVDDAISLRQTLSLTLQKSGYQVLQAQNGIEALEQLHLHPEIEVVISDLEMPRMNGFELLSQIRQDASIATKPVVVLTSRSAEKHRQLAYELGANSYLTKPYLEHEFISTVNTLANINKDDSSQGLITAGK
jgi:two-component system, chemotaxis family, sensor histidine kinase and response regulator PixL